MQHARVLVVVMLAAMGATASAQQPRQTSTKISEDSARVVALAKVKGGSVHSSELTRHGRWPVYEFDIQRPGKAGYEEVDVNAMNGKVISRRHETAKQEAREARAEKKGETAEAKVERKEDKKAEKREEKREQKVAKPAAKP